MHRSAEDEAIRLLADGTNRAILRYLAERDEPVALEDLATHLLSKDTLRYQPTDIDEQQEHVRIRLHHQQLPQLDGVGLLQYERDEGRVYPQTYPPECPEWHGFEQLETVLSTLDASRSSEPRFVGILEGSEAIYRHARTLTDRAKEEVFLIYASSELLHEDCLPHAEQAIERNVSFYAGAKSKDAREFFSSSLPEATVWEPQFDWLHEADDYPTISRLIFVDRTHLVVGLWETRDGERTEVGLVGEGETNPFVALVRELLGPRLDHLDYQSDTFLEGLPFEG